MRNQEVPSIEEREEPVENISEQAGEKYPENRISDKDFERIRQTEDSSTRQEIQNLRNNIAKLYENRVGVQPHPEMPEAPVRYEPAKPDGVLVRGVKFLFSPVTEVVNLFNGIVRSVKGVVESAGGALSKIFGATGHVAEKTGEATGKVVGAVGHVSEKTGGAAGELIEEGGKLGGETMRTTKDTIREGGGFVNKVLETGKNVGRTAAAITDKVAKLFGG
jgi:hypothetical protein